METSPPPEYLPPAFEFPTYLDFLNAHLPKGWTTKAKHIQCFAEHIDAMERGEIDRLAIHSPPRHGKTETATVPYPVLCLGRRPTENVLVTAYNDRFARRLARKSRNKALLYGLDLDPSKLGTDEWAVLGGGSYVARGVGSPPTGIGFGRVLIEDPIRDRMLAESEAFRNRSEDWYADEVYTRLEPRGGILLNGTLWAQGDLYDFIKSTEPGRWVVVKLPAIAEEADLLGRSVGEALWPERWPVEELERRRQVMLVNEGERSWRALYQQDPQLAEGNYFKRGDFKLINSWEVPQIDHLYRGYDLATSVKQTGHLTASQKWGVDGVDIYVFDARWFKKEFPDARADIVETAVHDGPQVAIGIENKMAGMAMVQDLNRVEELASHAIWPIDIKGDKKDRASAFAARARAGHVYLVKPDSGPNWIPEYIRTYLAFDGAGTVPDDLVDAGSITFQMIQAMRGGHQPSEQELRPQAGTYGYYEALERQVLERAAGASDYFYPGSSDNDGDDDD